MPLDDWPSSPGDDRDQKTLEAVVTGRAVFAWCPLTLSDGENTLELEVSCDALKVDDVRVDVNAKTQQKIADMLFLLLLTPKLSDAIWSATASSNRLFPLTMPYNPATGGIPMSTASMIEQSQRIDSKLAAQGAVPDQLVSGSGKDWVIARAIFTPNALAAKKAANYGFHVSASVGQRARGAERSVSIPNEWVLQGVGTAHPDSHTDYSQLGRWVKRSAKLNGADVDLADVYTGASPGNALVSHEGPLPGFAQGGTPSTPTVPPMALVPPGTQTMKPPPKTPPVGGVPSAASAATGGKAGTTIAGTAVGATIGAVIGTQASTVLGALAGAILGWWVSPKRVSSLAASIPALPDVPGTIPGSLEAGWPVRAWYIERWKWVAGWVLDCSGSEACHAQAVPNNPPWFAWRDWGLHVDPASGGSEWVDHGWSYSWRAA